MKQKTLFKLKDYSSEYGGSLSSGRRKSSRPLSFKNALKIVLKGDTNRSGSLRNHVGSICSTFNLFSEKFGVKIYEKAIAGNHIHFVALFTSRQQYVNFIRALSGTIALRTKIKWTFRPWTRILAWGRAFDIAISYVVQNYCEVTGVIDYVPRKKPPKKC